MRAKKLGQELGYRRAHGKGLCFDGVFRASGAASQLSKARVFAQPETPAIGRFSTGGFSPYAADNSSSTVSMALMLTADDGQQWRMKMNNEPYFPTRDAPGFIAMLKVLAPVPDTGKPDSQLVAAFLTDYPEARKYMEAAAFKPWSSSFAGSTYYAIHAYYLIAKDGQRHAMRWWLRPHAKFTAWSVEERAQASHDALFEEVAQRLTQAPLHWDLVLQLAAPGDPVDDPSQPWPETREQVVAGTLEVRRVFDETDGVCRDINFDPTLMPAGMALSNDPLLATRAGIYAHSYNARLREIGYGKATDAVGKKAATMTTGTQRSQEKEAGLPEHFNLLARLLHWAMAVAILAMLFIGVGMMSSLTWRPWLLDLHQPLGIAILLLAIVRLVNRLRHGAPALPADLPRWQVLAAKASHWLLYALMLLLPLLGWGVRSAGGWPVTMFPGVTLPPIAPTHPVWYAVLRDAHGLLAWLLFAVVLMHLAAALMHAWVRRDGVFSSMAPGGFYRRYLRKTT